MSQVTNTETRTTEFSPLGIALGAVVGFLVAPWTVKIYLAYVQ